MTKQQRKEYEKKCKEYARFLRDDADFDWTYILLLLRYKLQRTRRCLLNGHLEGAEKRAAEIQEVMDLLWKVTEHDYSGEALAAFYKKHGKPKPKLIPHIKGASRVELIYKNGKPATADSLAAMSKEEHRLRQKAARSQIADLQKAFRIMLENIWGWWD